MNLSQHGAWEIARRQLPRLLPCMSRTNATYLTSHRNTAWVGARLAVCHMARCIVKLPQSKFALLVLDEKG
jgi:hypothetical protein